MIIMTLSLRITIKTVTVSITALGTMILGIMTLSITIRNYNSQYNIKSIP